jgi:hypothetical protein
MPRKSEVLLASAVRAATNFSQPVASGAETRGLFLTLAVTAVPGVDTVGLTLQVRDPVTGVWIDYVVFAAFATAVTAYNVIYPTGFATAAAPGISATNFAVVNAPIPNDWRVKVTHSAATNFTYSVSYQEVT